MSRLSDLARERKVITALYVAFGAVLVAIAAEYVRSLVAEASSRLPILIGLVTIIGLLLVLSQLAALKVQVEALADKSGFSINYYEAGNATEKEELHRQAQRVIRRAPGGSHIYAVNSYLEVFSESNEPEDDRPQRDYLREFERRFSELSYHRLIQLKNGDRPIQLVNGSRMSSGSAPLAQLLTNAYLEHYRSIVNGAQRGHGNVLKLEEVNATIPTSFVVVKHGTGGEIIWQIHRHKPRPDAPDAMQILGIFIITDPDGLLVPTFMQWFNTIDSGQARLVTPEDLTERC